MIPSDESPPQLAQIPVQIYQFHVLLLTISPAIWRRFLIRSDSTIADLHYILQIVLGWDDEHLHQFSIHGRHFDENTEQGRDREDPIVEETFSFERTKDGDKLTPESLGLTLDEAKSLLAGVQKKLVSEQVANYLSQKSDCPQCHKAFQHKGRHKISFSTLFGKLKLDSPRLWRKRWSR
jgi:hypothetical protein